MAYVTAQQQRSDDRRSGAPRSHAVLIALLRRTYDEWRDDRGSLFAAGLACFTTLSLAPMAVVALYAMGLAFGNPHALDRLVEHLKGEFGPVGARALRAIVASASRAHGNVLPTMLSLLLSLFAASRMCFAVRDCIDVMWDVPARERRNTLARALQDYVVAAVLVLTVAFVVVLLLPATSAVHLLSGVLAGSSHLRHHVFARAADFVGSALLLWLIFTLIYKHVPRREVAWGDARLGAGAAALLAAAGQALIGWYLSRGSLLSASGAAASLVVVLLWLYYSATIFLMGAEFTQVYTRHFNAHRSGTTRRAGDVRASSHASSDERRAARDIDRR